MLGEQGNKGPFKKAMYEVSVINIFWLVIINYKVIQALIKDSSEDYDKIVELNKPSTTRDQR